MFLTYEQTAVDEGAYTVDSELAINYLAAAQKLSLATGLVNDLTLSSLLKVPDVVTKEQAVEDEDLLAEMTLEALKQALDNLKVMREREGLALKADISRKLDNIASCLAIIKEFAPLVVEDYREGLNARIAEVVAPTQVDMQRLATEVALYADHCAIDEEITRLGTHISNMRALLDADEPVGRKMDFLVQEFNRETNTIGSKANDMRITGQVLAIKNEIEKCANKRRISNKILCSYIPLCREKGVLLCKTRNVDSHLGLQRSWQKHCHLAHVRLYAESSLFGVLHLEKAQSRRKGRS